jgi:2-deoxy-D-gluconate 3-dehydrogenase
VVHAERHRGVDVLAARANIIGVSQSLNLTDSDVQKEVEALGRSFTAYQCDFSDRKNMYSFIENLTSSHTQIDIVVNNAGTIKRNPIIAHTDEDWDNVLATNLSSQFILSREIGKSMITAGSGKIIFVASLLSFQGGILVPGYAASKGGIQSLIKSFANEWASLGVNVNGIAPGYISTDNTEALRNDAERSKSILSRIPANRWGNAEDLVGASVFLSSPASDYVNGTILTVDGGWMGR